jgi:hypothetical protein
LRGSPHKRVRSVCIALACVALVSFAGPSWASGADRAWKTIRVGVLPGDSFVRIGAQMFEEDVRTRDSREAMGVWRRRVEEALRKLDLVRVVE